MRLDEAHKLTAETQAIKIKNELDAGVNSRINWPDLTFGPVNLWCLPSASFFYGKLIEKKQRTLLM